MNLIIPKIKIVTNNTNTNKNFLVKSCPVMVVGSSQLFAVCDTNQNEFHYKMVIKSVRRFLTDQLSAACRKCDHKNP